MATSMLFVCSCAKSDPISIAAHGTDSLLKKYERVKDPKEIRTWLLASHGDADGQEVMYSPKAYTQDAIRSSFYLAYRVHSARRLDNVECRESFR